jgi:phage terminase large subunit
VSGGEIFYKGLALNITSIKSIGNVKRLWIEEGESISANSLKVLTPSIRSTASSNANDEDPPEIWVTMNRASKKDAIAKKYLSRAEPALRKCGYYEDDLMIVVQLNWRDNPWFPPELNQERLDDFINLSRAEYRHIWEGDYYDEVENSIIPVEWFDAAIDAHIKLGFEPRGLKVTSHDPSDGGDNKGISTRHGSVFTRIGEIATADVNDGFDEAANEAISNGSDYFVWDGGGMGVSLRRQASTHFSGKHIRYEMFNGGAKIENPDDIYEKAGSRNETTAPKTNNETFFNLRAQKAWKLRDRFYKTYLAVTKKRYYDPDELVSIDAEGCNVDEVRAEVCRMPRKMRSDGMIQLVSKVDMKKKPYEMESPGMFDSMMMSEITVDLYESSPTVVVESAGGWS